MKLPKSSFWRSVGLLASAGLFAIIGLSVTTLVLTWTVRTESQAGPTIASLSPLVKPAKTTPSADQEAAAAIFKDDSLKQKAPIDNSETEAKTSDTNATASPSDEVSNFDSAASKSEGSAAENVPPNKLVMPYLLKLSAPNLPASKSLALDSPEIDCCGTAVNFVTSPAVALREAVKKQKLVFLLHVSGDFEDPGFT